MRVKKTERSARSVSFRVGTLFKRARNSKYITMFTSSGELSERRRLTKGCTADYAIITITRLESKRKHER